MRVRQNCSSYKCSLDGDFYRRHVEFKDMVERVVNQLVNKVANDPMLHRTPEQIEEVRCAAAPAGASAAGDWLREQALLLGLDTNMSCTNKVMWSLMKRGTLPGIIQHLVPKTLLNATIKEEAREKHTDLLAVQDAGTLFETFAGQRLEAHVAEVDGVRCLLANNPDEAMNLLRQSLSPAAVQRAQCRDTMAKHVDGEASIRPTLSSDYSAYNESDGD